MQVASPTACAECTNGQTVARPHLFQRGRPHHPIARDDGRRGAKRDFKLAPSVTAPAAHIATTNTTDSNMLSTARELSPSEGSQSHRLRRMH